MSRALVPARASGPRKLRADEPTLARLGRLGEILCSSDEVAVILGVDEPELARFLASPGKAHDAYQDGRGRGLEALRRAQFKLAETNATMAIFLGKNHLGQADRRELEQSGAIDLSQAAQRVRDKLAAIAAAADASGDREGE